MFKLTKRANSYRQTDPNYIKKLRFQNQAIKKFCNWPWMSKVKLLETLGLQKQPVQTHYIIISHYSYLTSITYKQNKYFLGQNNCITDNN